MAANGLVLMGPWVTVWPGMDTRKFGSPFTLLLTGTWPVVGCPVALVSSGVSHRRPTFHHCDRPSRRHLPARQGNQGLREPLVRLIRNNVVESASNL